MIVNPYAVAAPTPAASPELDTASKLGGWTLSESNLRGGVSGASYVESGIRLNTAITASGSTYFEVYVHSNTGNDGGITLAGTAGALVAGYWNGARGYRIHGSGNINHNGSAVYAVNFGVNNIIGVLIKNGKLYTSKNGVWVGNPNAETGASWSDLSGEYYPGIYGYYIGVNYGFRLSSASMTYPVPTGASTMVP